MYNYYCTLLTTHASTCTTFPRGSFTCRTNIKGGGPKSGMFLLLGGGGGDVVCFPQLCARVPKNLDHFWKFILQLLIALYMYCVAFSLHLLRIVLLLVCICYECKKETLNEPLPPLPSPPPTHSHRKNPIDIRRDRLDEAKFEKGFRPAKISVRDRLGKLVVPPQLLKSALKPPCSQQEWLQFLLTHVPILSRVWSYWPGFLIGDFIAGITVAIMHFPQGGLGGVCCNYGH